MTDSTQTGAAQTPGQKAIDELISDTPGQGGIDELASIPYEVIHDKNLSSQDHLFK